MFPIKGTTVWVNFRDKPYLGKVLQTSPELNMVCVRISNYLDYISRDPDQTDLVAHSCPVSNQSQLSNRHSSVVITCGLEDICLIESNNDPHFTSKHHESSNDNKSEIIIESNPVRIPKKIDNRDMVHNNSSRNNLQNTNSLEDENELSSSFGIKKLLKSSEIEDGKSFAQNKYWQCWHCYIFLSNENDMHLHVINKHKLDSILDKDNWVVIGGIRGLDYDEVNSQENCNIKDLNNIHISTASRKRQFFDSTSGLSLSMSNEFQNQSYSYSAINHSNGESYKAHSEADSNFNEFRGQNICWSNLNGIVHNNNVEYLDGILYPSYNQINFTDFSTLTNDQVSYNRKMQFFQSFLLQHQLNSNFSSTITNPSHVDNSPYRLRSNSDQLNSHLNHMQTCVSSESKEMVQEILSPSKRSRLETGIKKCRKMYGIDQRHLWCNQCKWKKACSRFLSEININ